ncbi:MAG: hypothetical protein VB036_13490 [Propionicimonas sp.]|nr:hypothetical protein [Propionicimonas sp.]
MTTDSSAGRDRRGQQPAGQPRRAQLPDAGQTRPDQHPAVVPTRRFWLLALTVCLALALTAGGLTVANATRGPELTDATVAADRAVVTGGERLVLRGRQPLDEVDAAQVEITPSAPFTVETKDAEVVIRFSRPLAYATAYTVRVGEVRSRHTGVASDWTYSFTTPGYSLYSLVGLGPWGYGEADQVIRTDPATGQPTPVLTGTGIESFTVVAGVTVALSREPDAVHLIGSAPSGSGQFEFSVPDGVDVGLLQGSTEQPLIGYTLTGEDTASGRSYDNALFLRDVTDPAQPAREIGGQGGTELRVTDWAFIPGTQSLVVEDDAQQFYLTSTAEGASLVPLGNHDQLIGFLPGSTSLVVLDKSEEMILDLVTGTSTPLPQATDDPADEYSGKRTMITPSEWIQQVDDLTETADEVTVTSRITHTRDGVTTDVTSIGAEFGRLLDTGVSANGQYAWAEVLDPGAPADDLTSGATDKLSTFLFDLTTGHPVAVVPGGRVLWVSR